MKVLNNGNSNGLAGDDGSAEGSPVEFQKVFLDCSERLFPLADRDGAYVGAFGIDCCTGNLVADASFGSECKVYYPK